MNRARRIATVEALALAAGLIATMALAGCRTSTSGSANAGSAGTGTPATSTTTPATTTTAPATTPAGGKLTALPTSCPTADLVMSNLHLSSLTLSSLDPSLCTYDHDGDKQKPYVAIAFNMAPGFTGAAVKSGLVQNQSRVQAVSGVGDAAFTYSPKEGSGTGTSVLSGGILFSIVTTVPAGASDEIALAKAIIQG